MKIYAGIGSRKTPKDVLNLMEEISKKLSSENWILRSGGAIGADTAFEKYAIQKEIYTPDNFDRSKENLEFCYKHLLPTIDKGRNFFKFSQETKLKLCRNVHQILGKFTPEPVHDLFSDQHLLKETGLPSLSKMVIFWMPFEDIWDKNNGGTKYAVRMAENLKIPLFNLKNKDTRLRIERWLGKNCA